MVSSFLNYKRMHIYYKKPKNYKKEKEEKENCMPFGDNLWGPAIIYTFSTGTLPTEYYIGIFLFLLTIVFQPFQGLLYIVFNGLFIYTIIYLTKASCLKLTLIIVLYHYWPSLDIYFVFIYWWLCNLGANFLREKAVFVLITYSPIAWCLAIWILLLEDHVCKKKKCKFWVKFNLEHLLEWN